MASAAYTTAAADFTKQVQWLVEIDLDRCNNSYTQAPCTAADAGDGSRCYHTFGTCQDPANFVKTTRTLRFCLNDVPWPDQATAVYPLLEKIVGVPQEVSPDKLFSFPEKISFSMLLDYLPPVPDSDKGTGFFNTSSVGEFWHNLFARSRNYSGRPVRFYRGFNASGFVLSDFEKIGPTYELKQVKFGRDTCKITAESPLAALNKRQVPWNIGDDNLFTTLVDNVATTWVVTDGSLFPDPADFTRNNIYVEIEDDTNGDEIAQVTSITGNNLTVVRGSFGTTNIAHAAGLQVKHVACFGTTAGAAQNSLDTMRDLLEWAGIAGADVDTAAFDDIKDTLYSDDDVVRVVRRQKTAARLIQQIREIRGIVLFINSAGKWSVAIMGPNLSSSSLDDDSFILDSVSVFENDNDRNTRVAIWYDPIEENSSEPDDFRKVLAVVNAGLEGANNFNDVRERTVFDPWIDAALVTAKIRNIARRVITRTGYGVRTVTFELDVKDGTLNVGDMRTGATRELTGITGEQKSIPMFITSKREVRRGTIRYEGVDTNFSGRFLRIGPDTMTAAYDSATEDDKQYGYWGSTTFNRVGTLAEDGYVIF